MLKLFFIAANDDNGENQDRIVWAADEKEAIRLANDDWGFEEDDFDGPAHNDCRITEIDVTLPSQAGVVAWRLRKVLSDSEIHSALDRIIDTVRQTAVARGFIHACRPDHPIGANNRRRWRDALATASDPRAKVLQSDIDWLQERAEEERLLDPSSEDRLAG